MKSRWKLHFFLKVDIMRKTTSYLAYSTMPQDDENYN